MHPTAKAGFQDASRYEQFRPNYTNECVDRILEIGGLLNLGNKAAVDPKPCVLELGAGTGRFTEKFLERCTKGVRVIATDPNPLFLEHLRQKQLPVEIMLCMADNIKLANDSVDYVVAAQSFHWFANRETLLEIHRVMKNGAKFSIIWKLQMETTPWMKKLAEFIDDTSRRLNTPIPMSYEWKAAFHESLDLFSPLPEAHMHIVHITFLLHEFVSYLMTLSIFASQSDCEKKASEMELLSIVSTSPDLNNTGVLNIPFRTELYWVAKI